MSADFASEPACQVGDHIASPQVLHKPAVALHDAWCQFRSFAQPALSPQREKQATSDDAVAVELEDTAIVLACCFEVSPTILLIRLTGNLFSTEGS